MRKQIAAFVFCAAALALPALAQTSQLPAPSPIEKELAARASHVDEITLDKKMLSFAANFMNGKKTLRSLSRASKAFTSASTSSKRRGNSPPMKSSSCASTLRPASGPPW
jgi:hypothetical protein